MNLSTDISMVNDRMEQCVQNEINYSICLLVTVVMNNIVRNLCV